MTAGRCLLLAVLRRTCARYVAARCRVTTAAVYHWAAGRNAPCRRARRTLCAVYSIPPESWAAYTDA